MALVHDARGHDLSLCGLCLVVIGIIAAAVPCLQFLVDEAFALFK